MRYRDWIEGQVEAFGALRGRTILEIVGVEMAFDEPDPPTAPRFSSPDLPCLQIDVLHLIFTSALPAKVITYQNDLSWGLQSVQEAAEDVPRDFQIDGIFRTRPFPELPLGTIQRVSGALDKAGDISRIDLLVGSKRLILVPGEISHEGDELVVRVPDESVLVFRTSADLKTAGVSVDVAVTWEYG